MVAEAAALRSGALDVAADERNRWPEWLIATSAAWLVCSVILYFASGFRHPLGQRGLLAVERLMGMVLVTIAIQMLMTGIGQFVSLVPNREKKAAAATVGGGCQFPERWTRGHPVSKLFGRQVPMPQYPAVLHRQGFWDEVLLPRWEWR
jgi:hypothetical protein